MNFSRRTLKGFSLIETVFVLLIMGVMGSLSLTFLKAKKEATALEVTRAHQERIARAVANYILGNGCIPLPSGSPEGNSFSASSPQALEVFEGVTPFKTLGIPPFVAKDGWGNYFTYAVNTALSQPDDSLHLEKFCRYSCKSFSTTSKALGKSLYVQTPEGKEMAPLWNPIILLIISHGPRGEGAYKTPGEKEKKSHLHAPPLEKLNIDPRVSSSGVLYVYAPYRPHGDGSFRQIMLALSRDDLLSFYGHFCCQSIVRKPLRSPSSPSKEEKKEILSFLPSLSNPMKKTVSPSFSSAPSPEKSHPAPSYPLLSSSDSLDPSWEEEDTLLEEDFLLEAPPDTALLAIQN